MERREFLVAASISVACLAGCARVTPGAESGGTPSPTSIDEPLSEYGCPPDGPADEPVVCSHTVDTDAADVYLLTDPTSRSETPTLTLYNESTSTLEFNPYQWSVTERTSSGWGPIERRQSGNGRLVIAAGETRSWTFGEVVDYINERRTPDAGTYAASIDISEPGGSDWIRCTALVRLG
jgi:hypothetical protein